MRLSGGKMHKERGTEEVESIRGLDLVQAEREVDNDCCLQVMDSQTTLSSIAL